MVACLHFPDFRIPRRACFVSTPFASPSDLPHVTRLFTCKHKSRSCSLSFILQNSVHLATTQNSPLCKPSSLPAHISKSSKHDAQDPPPLNPSHEHPKPQKHALDLPLHKHRHTLPQHNRIPGHLHRLHQRFLQHFPIRRQQGRPHRVPNRRVLGQPHKHHRVQDSRLLAGGGSGMAHVQGHR